MNSLRYMIHVLLLLPLAGFLYWQGRRVRAQVPRLGEASQTKGKAGRFRSARHVLLLGESAFAGVGVRSNQSGIAGRFAHHWSRQQRHSVHWRLYARNGYNMQRLVEQILPQIPHQKTDLILIGMGGNDAFELTPPARFGRQTRVLIETLRERYPDCPIVFGNVPPVYAFPAFPVLLQFALGGAVKILKRELCNVTAAYRHVYFDERLIHFTAWQQQAPAHTSLADFFSDGVHPSALAYDLWAAELARFTTAQLQPSQGG
ncbi:MAG: SGNH/GDSL hydrolase family protein [Leptospiraceae bacterium]|nr:SGNH/GDSL hydrolase family protein [Leptospiraceae bacterium]